PPGVAVLVVDRARKLRGALRRGGAPLLTILFHKPTIWIVPFVVVSVAVIYGLPRIAPWFFGRYGDRVIEPEIKLVFACLFLLVWLGSRANSQAALPAFILRLVMSRHYVPHRPQPDPEPARPLPLP